MSNIFSNLKTSFLITSSLLTLAPSLTADAAPNEEPTLRASLLFPGYVVDSSSGTAVHRLPEEGEKGHLVGMGTASTGNPDHEAQTFLPPCSPSNGLRAPVNTPATPMSTSTWSTWSSSCDSDDEVVYMADILDKMSLPRNPLPFNPDGINTVEEFWVGDAYYLFHVPEALDFSRRSYQAFVNEVSIHIEDHIRPNNLEVFDFVFRGVTIRGYLDSEPTDAVSE